MLSVVLLQKETHIPIRFKRPENPLLALAIPPIEKDQHKKKEEKTKRNNYSDLTEIERGCTKNRDEIP